MIKKDFRGCKTDLRSLFNLMKILELAYEDKVTGWKLHPVQFSDLNLLVGVSGVGKTKILRAILTIKAIANGLPDPGAKWFIRFLDTDQVEYEWQGEFELSNQNTLEYRGIDEYPKITNEFLQAKSLSLSITRDSDKISFNGQDIAIKLSPNQSVVKIFSGEPQISLINREFKKIIDSQASHDFDNRHFHQTTNIKINKSHWDSYQGLFDSQKDCDSLLSRICSEDIFVQQKIVLAYFFAPKFFESIKNRFIDIFPQVENIKCEEITVLGDELLFSILVKEKNIEHQFVEFQISSGMLKTLFHLGELYLSTPGSVILIDEFENSLGVNCLDAVTEDLIDAPNRLQFILTSHHPYVINNIRPSHWKIVTRQGGEVTVKNAEDFHISSSRHKAYIDLINILKDNEEE